MSSHTLAVAALLLALAALAAALAAAAFAVTVRRQSAAALTELRRVPDPKPRPDPAVDRISAELETLGGLYEDLTVWAHSAEARLPHPAHDDDEPAATTATPAAPATAAMPAADRPRPAHRP